MPIEQCEMWYTEHQRIVCCCRKKGPECIETKPKAWSKYFKVTSICLCSIRCVSNNAELPIIIIITIIYLGHLKISAIGWQIQKYSACHYLNLGTINKNALLTKTNNNLF